MKHSNIPLSTAVVVAVAASISSASNNTTKNNNNSNNSYAPKVKPRHSLLSRTESLDTLSPCESIASDDLMLDFECHSSMDSIDRFVYKLYFYTYFICNLIFINLINLFVTKTIECVNQIIVVVDQHYIH